MIGIYDSGIGGLTALSRLRSRLTRADLLYLADTAHLPYGEKSPRQIREYARSAFSFLERQGVSQILVACGTVSTSVLEADPILDTLPSVGVVRPAVDRALASGCKRIAVLATSATVASGVFQRLLRASGCSVLPLACPSFVPLIEGGVHLDDPRLLTHVRTVLAPLLAFAPDAILLGCTHFPILSPLIAGLFPSARLIDSAQTAADSLVYTEEDGEHGETSFFVTDDPARFREAAQAIYPIPAGLTVRKVVL